MPSLSENIEIIRSTGIYGPDIREAIASAIEQSDDYIDGRIEDIAETIDDRDLFMDVSKIAGTEDDYLLTITNAESPNA